MRRKLDSESELLPVESGMEIGMKANLKIAKEMGKEYTIMRVVADMREIGKMVIKMERGFTIMRVVAGKKGSMRMIKHKEKPFSTLPVEK